MTRPALILAACLLLSGPGMAKPLLTNSQDSHAKACLDFDDTYERIIRICEIALAGRGYSQAERLEMMEALGDAHYALDQNDAALAVFEEMLRISPDNSAALAGIGWVRRDAEDFAGAAASFEAAMGVLPSAEAIGGRAAARYHDGQIGVEEVLSQLDASLAINPEYRWAMREKGWILDALDRHEEAEAAFQAALDLEPDDVNARHGLAESLRKQGRLSEALVEINKAIALEPDAAWHLAERSRILFFLDRNKQSIKDAERVIELEPTASAGYVRKARALSSLGRTQDAITVLTEAEAQTGFNAYMVFWRADILADDGAFEESLVQIERLVEAGVEDLHDLHLMAFVQLGRQDVAGARAAVEAAKARGPDNSFTLYYDARVLVEERRFDEAEAQMTAAVAAGLPEESIALFLRALAAKGDFVRMIRLRIAFSE